MQTKFSSPCDASLSICNLKPAKREAGTLKISKKKVRPNATLLVFKSQIFLQP